MLIKNVYFLLCTLYLVVETASKSTARYQIDEFIKELMKSDKFNYLADAIAERTALKMAEPTKQALRYNPKTIKDITFGKANSKAFLKRDDSKLYLNYKNLVLTNGDQSSRNSYISDSDTDNKDDKISREKTDKRKKDKSNKAKVQDEDNKHNHGSQANQNNEDNLQKVEPNTTMNGHTSEPNTNATDLNNILHRENGIQPSGKVKGRINRDINDANKEEFDESSVGKTDDFDEPSARKTEDFDKPNARKTDDFDESNARKTDDFDEPGAKKADEFDESSASKTDDFENSETKRVDLDESSVGKTVVNLNEPSAEKVDGIEEIKVTKTVRSVRRENGKLYTYLSSPDYDEYHENVAKIKYRNSFL